MKKFRKVLLAITMTLFIGSTFALFSSCKDDKNGVKLSFETNCELKDFSKKVKKGKEYTLPVPEREGYAFEGWYVSEDLSGDPVVTVTVDKGTKYYAKWAEVYDVTLALDGGSLATTALELKAGENVYEAVKDLTPEKSGFVFGAWFIGDNELSKNYRMPAESLTLTAKYKVGYTVELWLQNEAMNGYDKSEQSFVDYDYVGATYEGEPDVTGFEEISHASAVVTGTVSATASENVFKHYFDREDYKITFRSNYPEDAWLTEVTEEVDAFFGIPVSIPSNFACEGYCLIGWATSPTGEVVHKANYYEDLVYNDNATSEETATLLPERTGALYAVWEKGYVDMFGGNDYVYLFDETGTEIFISRGDVFFKGEYDPELREFTFERPDGELLTGCLNENGTFIYRDEERAEVTSTFYDVLEGGTVSDVTVTFDTYNGLTYYNGEAVPSKGKYIIAEDGTYSVKFYEGDLEGQTLSMIFSEVEDNNGDMVNVFQIRNDEEYGYGLLDLFVVYGAEIVNYSAAIDTHQLLLTGFHLAIINNQGTEETYVYFKDEEEGCYSLLDLESGEEALTFKVVEFGDLRGYMFYNYAQDQTFGEEGGATLTLDGMYNATYKNGDQTFEGFYTLTESVFGSAIVTVEGSGTRVFMLDSNEDGSVYTVTERASTYSEFVYSSAEGAAAAPLLVLGETAKDSATLYGVDENGNYLKVSEGKWAQNETTKQYVYTAENHFNVDVVAAPFDLKKVDSFVFELNFDLTEYQVHYWYSFTDEDGVDSDLYEDEKLVLTSQTDDKTITIFAGFAFYKVTDNDVRVGLVQVSEDGNYLQFASNQEYIYFEYNESEQTFLELDELPYETYGYTKDGYENKNETIYYDGKGGATYTLVTLDQDGEVANTETHEGTYEDTGKIAPFGSFKIFRFVSTGKTFEFIRLQVENQEYFAIYDETYSGDFTGADGMLRLDGFHFGASFTDSNGDVYNGMYVFDGENVVCLMLDYTTLYFDLTVSGTEKTFTLRGEEFATYIVVDNQLSDGVFLAFDGYGKVKAYTYAENGDEDVVDENGTYSIDGDVVTVEYKDKNDHDVVLVGKFGVVAYGEYLLNSFVIIHEEAKKVYVDQEDWSVLILDEVGGAEKYDAEGIRETGTYTLISESLLFYMNEDGTDAHLYEYDAQTGNASIVRMSGIGYFTEDLEPLYFTKYGIVNMGDNSQMYYNFDENNDVVIYRKAEAGETGNAYGFVTETFGETPDTKDWKGKTYYKGNFLNVIFERESATATQYPVNVSSSSVEQKEPLENLAFTPTGVSNEFELEGTVWIDEQAYDCYVVRELNEEGGYDMFLLIGAYQFDIEISFHGSAVGAVNTYKVVGMSYSEMLISYNYMDMYYLLAMWSSILGDYANMLKEQLDSILGVIVIESVYNENGESVENYVSGSFEAGTGLADTNGNIFNFEKQAYVFEDGTFVVTLQGTDGMTYRLYFAREYHQAFGMDGYQVLALTREQTLTANDGYTVVTERVVVSDVAPQGSVWSATLYKDDVVVEIDDSVQLDDTVYFMVRTKDSDEVVTGVKFYSFKPESANESETNGLYKDETTVTVVDGSVLYEAEGKIFAEIHPTAGLLVLTTADHTYKTTSCSYDETTKTYTLEATSEEGKEYEITVKVNDSAIVEVTIVEVQDEGTDEGGFEIF